MSHSKKLKENDVVVFKDNIDGLFETKDINQGDIGVVINWEYQDGYIVEFERGHSECFFVYEIEKIGVL